MSEPQRPEPLCRDCFHDLHLLRRCPEIVGSSGAPMPDPVYCECANVGAMEAEIRRLTARAAERTESGIDVERLTAAVKREVADPSYEDPRRAPITFAHRVARTYRALAADPRPPEQGDTGQRPEMVPMTDEEHIAQGYTFVYDGHNTYWSRPLSETRRELAQLYADIETFEEGGE